MHFFMKNAHNVLCFRYLCASNFVRKWWKRRKMAQTNRPRVEIVHKSCMWMPHSECDQSGGSIVSFDLSWIVSNSLSATENPVFHIIWMAVCVNDQHYWRVWVISSSKIYTFINQLNYVLKRWCAIGKCAKIIKFKL